MSTFQGKLSVVLVQEASFSQDGLAFWEVLSPFSYQSDVAKQVFTVPAGFKTDFMTIPRLPAVFDLLGGKANQAGTLHDWLYSSHTVEREVADSVLREAVQLSGLDETEAEAIYLAVREFGGSHW